MAFIAVGVSCLMAQPKARRQEQQVAKSNSNNMTLRQQIDFPTAEPMSGDVVWRRDVYRELDLNDEANAALYYPVEPNGQQVNLFTLLFKLIMAGPNHGGIAAYSYDVNSGSEKFDESLRLSPKKFLDDYHIFMRRPTVACISTTAIYHQPRSRLITSRKAATMTRTRRRFTVR